MFHYKPKFGPSLCILLLGMVLAAIASSGCGKKAPPVAPREAPLIGVSDLLGELNEGIVHLRWNHSSENARAAGYLILRAQSSVSQPECPECPLVYQKVDTIRMSPALRKKDHPLEFYHDVAAGFRYTFSVRPFYASGGQGPDSNAVVIVFPPE